MKHNQDIDFDEFINIGLNRAMRKLQSAFFKQSLATNDLSLQEWRALLNLAKFGECHVRELARLASLDASHVAKAVTQLEKRGLLESRDDENDARRKRVCATKGGHELVSAVWQEALDFDERVRAHLGKRKYAALKAAISAIQSMDEEDLAPTSKLEVAE